MDIWGLIWGLLESIENTPLATYMREGDLGPPMYISMYYVLLAAHGIGMGLVVGICLMLTARVFGQVPSFPLAISNRFMVIAWWGFGLNAVSGVLLFISQARRELLSWAYDVKMVLVLVAGLTMVVMMRSLRHIEVVPGADGTAVEVVPDGARTPALLTSIFWIGAVISGRVSGYVLPPPL